MGSKLTSRLPPILRSYYIVSFQGGWYLIIPRFFPWKNTYPFLPNDDHKLLILAPKAPHHLHPPIFFSWKTAGGFAEVGDDGYRGYQGCEKAIHQHFFRFSERVGGPQSWEWLWINLIPNRVCQWWYHHPITLSKSQVLSQNHLFFALNQQPPSQVFFSGEPKISNEI